MTTSAPASIGMPLADVDTPEALAELRADRQPTRSAVRGEPGPRGHKAGAEFQDPGSRIFRWREIPG